MKKERLSKKLIKILDEDIISYKRSIENIDNNLHNAQELIIKADEFLTKSDVSTGGEFDYERNIRIVNYKEQIEQLKSSLNSSLKLIANYNRGNYFICDDDEFYTYHFNIYTKQNEQHWYIYIQPQQPTQEKVALLCALNGLSVEESKRLLRCGGNYGFAYYNKNRLYYSSFLRQVPILIENNILISGYDAFVSNERPYPLYDLLFKAKVSKNDFVKEYLSFAGHAAIFGLVTWIFGIGVFGLGASLIALIVAGVSSIRRKSKIKAIKKFEEYITQRKDILEKFYEYYEITENLHSEQRAESVKKVLGQLDSSNSLLSASLNNNF